MSLTKQLSSPETPFYSKPQSPSLDKQTAPLNQPYNFSSKVRRKRLKEHNFRFLKDFREVAGLAQTQAGFLYQNHTNFGIGEKEEVDAKLPPRRFDGAKNNLFLRKKLF